MKNDKLLSVLILLLSLIASMAVFAQESQKQSCSISLVATRFNEKTRDDEFVKDLAAKDVKVRVGSALVRPDILVIDTSPKRVVIVLDASKKVSNAEWKMAMEIATHFVKGARPTDTFVLLLAGADNPAAAWVSGAQAGNQFTQWSKARPKPTGDEKNYDALMSAAKLLSPTRFGDAVFLFGHPKDSGSKATAEQVQEQFLRNSVRFYGMSFTNPLQEVSLPPDWNPNKPLPANTPMPKLLDVSAKTGYFFSFHDLGSLAIPGQTQLVKDFVADVYRGIAEPNRLSFSASAFTEPAKLEIDVADSNKRKIEPRNLHYPRMLYSCGGSDK